MWSKITKHSLIVAAGLVISQIEDICFIFVITIYQINEINVHISPEMT